ncbi:SpoIIE family protein phosphatase [Nocardioides rubriscoriae]|uniref:SpoIIE family protein phosphatase n=1 Tax=Nocardioides rubriscoriae TaxID=642762 RepID=UPI0011DF3272|nr:SpoIIE family protein phosphatase [Nocardioides rubriscoriae]
MLDDGLEVGALDEAPAAVLVVDLPSRQVVHVNDVAQQLAPGIGLPVDLDKWSDAAALRDPDGAQLSETDHPLSRVARSEPVAGQAVSAARRSAMGARRVPLWLVAMPMAGAPMLEQHALVVLLPLNDSRAASLRAGTTTPDDLPAVLPVVDDDVLVGRELRDRALSATALSFTVADALDPEQPLVWINPAFTASTGYEFDEAVGRNCRFLQGEDTDEFGPRRMREAIAQGVSTSVTLLNYRKDGTPFWNQVDLSPVRDLEGRIAHYVGIQTDVTLRVESELRTSHALESEREARADAEAARGRLSFLVEAVNRLSGTLDATECAERLLSLVVPYLADWALLLQVDAPLGDQGPSRMAGRHRHPHRQPEVDAYVEVLPDALRDGNLAELLLDGKEVRIIGDLDQPSSLRERAGYLQDLSLTELTRSLEGREAMLVALTGRSAVRDVLVLVRTGDRAAFDDEDVTMAVDLGRRAGLILENVALYRAQARIAEVLQHSLLPELPRIESVTAAARYVANQSGAEIGGDFYELLDLRDAGIGIAIGDVTGHDILSAAAMGHLKGLLRAAAYDNYARPAAVLEQVDHLMLGLGMPTIATAAFAHATRHGDGWRLTWTSAGHPPLLVRRPDGSAETLSITHNDVLLGLAESTRTQHEVLLPRGSTVLAYTDGLVERRREAMDEGLARLLVAVGEAPADVDGLCDHVLAVMGGSDRDDDIAVLAVTLE